MALRQSLNARWCAVALAGAAAVLPSTVWANPLLGLQAMPDPAVVGAPLALDVVITGVADLYAHQFTLSFDPAILQAAGVEAGPFLGTGGATFFDGGSIDNTGGSVSFIVDSLIGPVPGVSGTGVLARIHFSVSDAGVTALTFSDVLLINSNLDALSVQLDNRFLQAVPEPASVALFALGLAGVSLMRRRSAA